MSCIVNISKEIFSIRHDTWWLWLLSVTILQKIVFKYFQYFKSSVLSFVVFLLSVLQNYSWLYWFMVTFCSFCDKWFLQKISNVKVRQSLVRYFVRNYINISNKNIISIERKSFQVLSKVQYIFIWTRIVWKISKSYPTFLAIRY